MGPSRQRRTYPAAGQGHSATRCFIDCKCGHRSWGEFFGAVWMPDAPGDVWQRHRDHMDAGCRPRRAVVVSV